MSDISERIAHLSPTKRALLGLELQSKIDAIERLKAEPIAIIGIGCRFPGGANDPKAFGGCFAKVSMRSQKFRRNVGTFTPFMTLSYPHRGK